MSFFSTRGENCVTASQAILQGITPDGGLYVPAMFPPVSLSKISEMADMDYISRAVNVLKLFLEDFTIPEIEQAVKAAYGGDRFNDPAVAPLKKLDERHALATDWGMELTLDRDIGDARYIGIRMHDIVPGEGENAFRCRLTEEIENPFSFTLMLRRLDAPDAASVGWETDKAAWRAMRAEELSIRLPKEALLCLKE